MNLHKYSNNSVAAVSKQDRKDEHSRTICGAAGETRAFNYYRPTRRQLCFDVLTSLSVTPTRRR